MSSGIIIFGKEIPFYGILFTFGILLGGAIAIPRSRKKKLPKMDVIYCACFAAIGGLIGAKLLSILTTIDLIIEQKPSIFDIVSNGFVFYGGLIGGFLGLMLYCKVYKLPTLDYMDVFAPSVPFGHAFGRVGCFFSGCCYGQPYDGIFSVTYPPAYAAHGTPIGIPLLPIQLIEAVFLIILYVVLELLLYKNKTRGLSAFVYLVGYAVARFVLEFFRYDAERRFIFGMSTSQWISLMIIIVSLSVVVYRHFRKKSNKNTSCRIEQVEGIVAKSDIKE